jgi:PGF-CTERM protein
VTLHNPRERDNLTVRIVHVGGRIATHNVTVPAATTVDRTFEVTFETPRSGVVVVNGVPVDELTVATADDDPTTTKMATEVDDQPGFGPFVALFALLLGVLAVRRSVWD